MAETKQKASGSTSGKATRKQIAQKAARVTKQYQDHSHHLMLQFLSRTDIIKVSKSSSAALLQNYHIWVESRHRRYDVTRAEIEALLGHHIPDLLLRKEDNLSRFGLTHSVNDTS